ncbi:MAG TPA: efflux RND transporter periplasmic adaptor subunit [Steroidobacteraceae bacterium]|jgi:HlyD family secretion protein|nr:efflux RND transporter periplasmic adaptor subunit [Steroidobacteraceae bacterium]
MKTKNWLIIAALLLVVVVPVTLKRMHGQAGKSVDIEVVSKRMLAPSILASGALAYESQVTMAPEVTAQVKEILVAEGDLVKRDQLLMRLDPTAPRAEIEQYEALIRQSELTIETRRLQYEALLTKWQRFNALKDQGMIDANTLDDLVSQKNQAEVALRTSREALTQTQAQLNAARERLRKTEIRAPLNGQVTAIFIKVGETAVQGFSSIAGSQLLQVADTTHINAEINVDETDIARIKVGADAKVVPAAFPDQVLQGKVDLVSISPRQQIGQNNKSYPVRIRLTNTGAASFHPGMSCRAEVSTTNGDQGAVLAVPVQAVKYEELPDRKDKTTTSVFVFQDGKVSKQEVTVGTADDSYIAITKGIKEGDSVVVGPAKTLLFLKQGERVTVNTTPADAKTADAKAVGASSESAVPRRD